MAEEQVASAESLPFPRMPSATTVGPADDLRRRSRDSHMILHGSARTVGGVEGLDRGVVT